MENANTIVKCMLETNLYSLSFEDIYSLYRSCKAFRDLILTYTPFKITPTDKIVFELIVSSRIDNCSVYNLDFMQEKECGIDVYKRCFEIIGPPNDIENSRYVHPIDSAIMNNEYDKVELMVKHMKYINIHYCNDSTYIYEAAMENNVDIMKLLMDHGADINDKTYHENITLFERLYLYEDGVKTSTLRFMLNNGASRQLSCGTIAVLSDEEWDEFDVTESDEEN